MSQNNSHDVRRNEVGLIPFEVVEVVNKVLEIPKGVQLINAPAAWEKGEKGKDIVVAVLDTGCQIDHVDLKDRIIEGKNFTADNNSDPNNYSDMNGHGTHVAGTIAATENNQGVLGVAPQSKLLIVKVLGGPNGSGAYEWIIDGINYAVNWRGPNGEKVRVISMSLSGPNDVPELHQAVKNAVNNEILVVCAAGNSGDNNHTTDEKSYPGAYQEVVEVGAVDLNKKIAPFSESNKNVDLVGPGVEIYSTYKNGTYAKLSGTSMATPHISGGAALIIKHCESKNEFDRTLSEDEIYAQLIKRTAALDDSKQSVGNGLLDLAKE
ncbi:MULTISPECIES: S8 family peptidase [Bacillus]|uniref:S8 family peptidase n=1 Tax=Bacillus TaxID=1386 RepID=UPI0003309779|nr:MULTISPECIES: S8 family peptidase [Bacillus cereus group]EOP29562.1 intracellular serine protease [Bacillus cereus VD131]MBJ8043956.1 S8 family peptidase [Bacillus cereus group sp. N17]MCU5305107.1 S8 family peptidase [Bacillus toyonensis]MCU5728014.1 S8 family peptidase [Bacillus toyonensis]MDD9264281.1 S8 family peptidase [Bacillus toyonensis]